MTVDLSQYSTAAGAAKRLHKYLTEELDAGDNCKLYRPDENPRQNGAWAVSWEGGPYEWGSALTSGESLFSREGGMSFGTDPEVTGWYEQNDWFAEPHFSFDVQFYNE